MRLQVSPAMTPFPWGNWYRIIKSKTEALVFYYVCKYVFSIFSFSVYENEDDFDCDCVQPCQSRIYTTFIQNRKAFNQPEPRTQIYIYYTTKLISVG